MAHAPRISTSAANAGVNAIAALLDGGTLLVYTAPQPATADTAITTQTLLATCSLANPAFASAVNGVATAHAITGTTDAPASGTATWFRALTSGSARVVDGSCGTSDADCLLSSVDVIQHGSVTITAMTITQVTG